MSVVHLAKGTLSVTILPMKQTWSFLNIEHNTISPLHSLLQGAHKGCPYSRGDKNAISQQGKCINVLIVIRVTSPNSHPLVQKCLESWNSLGKSLLSLKLRHKAPWIQNFCHSDISYIKMTGLERWISG